MQMSVVQILAVPLRRFVLDQHGWFASRADSELVQYVEGAVPDVLATIRDTGDLPPEQAAQLHTNIRVFVALQVAKQSGEAVNGPDIAEASMPRPATVKQDSEEEAASKHEKVEQAVRTSVPSSCCESPSLTD